MRVRVHYTPDAINMHNLYALLAALAFAVTPFPIADSIRSSSTSSNLQFMEPGGGLSHVKDEHAVPRFLLKLYRQRHYPARKNYRNTITAFFLEGRLGESMFVQTLTPA